jgi:hypothetical protein
VTIEEQEDQRSEENAAAIDDLRRKLADGFAFVRSREVANAIATVTMEECIAQAIVDIEDDRSDIRPGRLSRIRSLKEEVLGAVDQALQMPADAFEHPDQGSANTVEDEEEEEYLATLEGEEETSA